MKKSNLTLGTVFLTLGAVFCAMCAVWPDIGILWGFAGGCIVPGFVMTVGYYYHTRPKNAPRYAEKLDRSDIEQNDERRKMLRGEAARIVYLLNLGMAGVVSIAINIAGIFVNIPYLNEISIALGTFWFLEIIFFVGVLKFLDNHA